MPDPGQHECFSTLSAPCHLIRLSANEIVHLAKIEEVVFFHLSWCVIQLEHCFNHFGMGNVIVRWTTNVKTKPLTLVPSVKCTTTAQQWEESFTEVD